MVAGSARTASEATNTVSSVLSGFASDLFVLRGSVRSRRKKDRPLDWELHANPLGIGALAVGGALSLWLMQLRLSREEIEIIEWEDINTLGTSSNYDDYLPAGYKWSFPIPTKEKVEFTHKMTLPFYFISPILAPFIEAGTHKLVDAASLLSPPINVKLDQEGEIAQGHYETVHHDAWTEYRFGPAYWDPLEKKWQQDELPPIEHAAYDEEVWKVDPPIPQYRCTGRCYKLSRHMTNEIVSRDGFKIVGASLL